MAAPVSALAPPLRELDWVGSCLICAELPVFAPAFAEALSCVRGESAGTPVEMRPLAPSPTPLCVPVPWAWAAPMAKTPPATRADRAREEAMVLLMSSPVISAQNSLGSINAARHDFVWSQGARDDRAPCPGQ